MKPHKTYWKQKADTAFKWVAKESKSLIEIQTEKLILRIEKKNGAIQYFDADRNLLVSENATEPRLLNNGECYTFFDWDKSEKLKSKGILAIDLTDLTNKARYISFGGQTAEAAACRVKQGLWNRYCIKPHSTLLQYKDVRTVYLCRR